MSLYDSLPSNMADAAYSNIVFDAIQKGNYEAPAFSTVTNTWKGRSGTFNVFTDALKIDGWRISVSAELEQKIADTLGCLLLTPLLANLIWQQKAVTLKPVILSQTQADLQRMGTKEYSLRHSQGIDAQLNDLGNPAGLKATVGKDWVISDDALSHPNRATNYGWHAVGAPLNCIGIKCYQDQGWAHDIKHVDYSQVCRLVRRDCVVDGVDRDLVDVLRDGDATGLINHTGKPQRILRQPGVPIVACRVPVKPSVKGTAGLGYGESGTEVCGYPSSPINDGESPWRLPLIVGSLAAVGGALYLARRYGYV